MFYKVIQETNGHSPFPSFIYVIYLMDEVTNEVLDRLSCETYECPDLADRACKRLNLRTRADLRQS
jgi:hypothetical protein